MKELYEVLNCYCNRNSGAVSKEDKEFMFSKSRFKDYKSSIQMRSNTLKGIKDDGDMSFIKG